MKKILTLLIVCSLVFAVADAKGSGGRGGSRGGSFSSSKSSGSSKPSVSTRPSTATTKTVSPTAKTSSTGKTMSKEGSVVGGDYQPKFRGGYVPPAGSTVYYSSSPDFSWLPFYLIMSSNSEQYKHQEAVVVAPDGTEQTVVDDEVSDAYVLNWVITVLFICGLLWFVGWLILRN